MFGPQNKPDARQRALEYATRSDFEVIFNDDMSALQTLAFLLTADQAKAEQCFVAGLEEGVEGNPVFRQWAHSWSKRVIIRNAIKMMSPAPGQANPSPAALALPRVPSERNSLMDLILELPPFERFVFVISVLEGHSVSDSASLLGCTLTELIRARSQALRQLARSQDAAVAPQNFSLDPRRFIGKLAQA